MFSDFEWSDLRSPLCINFVEKIIHFIVKRSNLFSEPNSRRNNEFVSSVQNSWFSLDSFNTKVTFCCRQFALRSIDITIFTHPVKVKLKFYIGHVTLKGQKTPTSHHQHSSVIFLQPECFDICNSTMTVERFSSYKLFFR